MEHVEDRNFTSNLRWNLGFSSSIRVLYFGAGPCLLYREGWRGDDWEGTRE